MISCVNTKEKWRPTVSDVRARKESLFPLIDLLKYFAFIIEGAGNYHCNYCQADCTSLRVKCAECTDFDLCLQVKCETFACLHDLFAGLRGIVV